MYQPLPNCTCSAATDIKKTREAEKMHQFVMGLDESWFGAICQTIISSDLDMDIGEIYAKVVQEEQRLNSAKDRETQQTAVGFVAKTETDQTRLRQDNGRKVPQCTHCGRRGHEKSGCCQLIGFPDWWEERPPNRGSEGGNRGGSRYNRGRGSFSADRPRNSGVRANAAHATTSNSSSFPEFSEEQWKALSQMINERTRTPSDKLNGKIRYGDLILDTGASHHMIGDRSWLENISSISSCPVGFADGNKTYATHVGMLTLTNRITLENVLFVPNLNCSLISVSKLLK